MTCIHMTTITNQVRLRDDGSLARSLAHLSGRCQSAVNVKQAQDVPVRRRTVGLFHISPRCFPFKKRNVVGNPIEIKITPEMKYVRACPCRLALRNGRSGPVQLTGLGTATLGVFRSACGRELLKPFEHTGALRAGMSLRLCGWTRQPIRGERRASGRVVFARGPEVTDGGQSGRGATFQGYLPLLPAAMWPCLFLTEKTPRHSNGTVDLLGDQHVHF